MTIEKQISLRKYGKRTEEKCPICLNVNLVLARGSLKCPVCSFKRSATYYLDLLGSHKEIKDLEVLNE